MRKKLFFSGMALCFLLYTHAQKSTIHLPQLIKIKNTTQLIVDAEPYLIFGGELGNSTASSNDYIRTVWPKLKQMNLNTVFAPVYWELMEPIEGRFYFSFVDNLIINARINKMKLVLLWFGVWKNSLSCYAPSWIKTNTDKLPRAIDKNGIKQEILTPFSRNNLEADKNAFLNLMQHLKQEDSKQNIVIAIQIENEIGMLPDAHTYDSAANKSFTSEVLAWRQHDGGHTDAPNFKYFIPWTSKLLNYEKK